MASTVNATAHGFSASDRFYFGNVLPEGTGIVDGQVYWVLAAGLTADAFTFSETDGGAAVVLSEDVTECVVSGAAVYTPIVDPADVMAPPVVPDAPGSCVLSSAAAIAPDGTVVTRLDITITQPVSATLRHTIVTVTGGSNEVKVVIPVGQATGSIASVVPGLTYTGTAIAYDTFGLASDPLASAGHVAVGDVTAPDQVTGAVASDGILSVAVAWSASASADLAHYEVQVDDNSGFTTPETYKNKTTVLNFAGAPGIWYFRIRAVDLTGNAGTYSSTVNATAANVGQHQIAGDARNALPYPGAEYYFPADTSALTALPGWVVNTSAGSNIRRDSGNHRSGACVFQFVATGTASVTAFSALVPALPQRRYNVYAWLRGFAGNAAINCQVIVQWRDITGAQISQVAAGNYSPGTVTTYFRIGSVLESPAGTTQVTFLLFMGGQSVGDRVYADDLELVLADEDVNHAAGNVVINSAGIAINNGVLSVQDEFGKSIISSGAIDGAMEDQMMTGVANGSFNLNLDAVPAMGRTATVPYWTLANSVGTGQAWDANVGSLVVGLDTAADAVRMTSDLIRVNQGMRMTFAISDLNPDMSASKVSRVVKIEQYDSSGTLRTSTTVGTTELTGGGAGVTTLLTGVTPTAYTGILGSVTTHIKIVVEVTATTLSLSLASYQIHEISMKQAGIEPVTRNFWLAAETASLDAATLINVGASPDLCRVVNYANAATQGAFWNFLIPPDWVSGVITVRPMWAPSATDAVAHTVRWSYTTKAMGTGSDITAAGTTVTWTGSSAARTANILVTDTDTSTTVTPVTAGERWKFECRRIGADAADSYVGDVRLLGLIVSYTANV